MKEIEHILSLKLEVLEKENLLADIQAKIERSENDKVYKENFEAQDASAL